MDSDDPFHDGERQLQMRYGTRERLARDGARLIRPFLSDQHREFFSALNYVVAALPDARQDPCPVILTGETGFIHCPSAGHLVIRHKLLSIWRPTLRVGDPIALLGIDLATLRRNRVNGAILNAVNDSVEIAVTHAFGNCAKYIKRRLVRLGSNTELLLETTPIVDSGDLTDEGLRIITSAETAFLATSKGQIHPLEFDISHRGGEPGFLRLTGRGRLRFQDYKGNGFFNSLGNLALNPNASLLIANFEQGRLLRLRGECRLIESDTSGITEQASPRAYDFVFTEWSLLNNPLTGAIT